MNSIEFVDKIMTPARNSRNKLMEITFVAPKRSAIKPLGIDKSREESLGMATIKLTIKKGNSYSLFIMGIKARGSSV